MQDTDTIVEDADTDATVDESSSEVIEEEPAGSAEIAILQPTRIVAIRHVIERQLTASQEVSSELLSTATDVTAVTAEAVAKVLGAISAGATLPAAFGQTSSELREFVADAGSRARDAVGDYISGRAVLPNAVVAGIADLTGSVIRAQGGVASTAVNSAFDIATVVTQGGDVRATLGDELDELRTAARLARNRVVDSASVARQGIRAATTVGEAE